MAGYLAAQVSEHKALLDVTLERKPGEAVAELQRHMQRTLGNIAGAFSVWAGGCSPRSWRRRGERDAARFARWICPAALARPAASARLGAPGARSVFTRQGTAAIHLLHPRQGVDVRQELVEISWRQFAHQ